MIKVEGLTKRFTPFQGVFEVNLEVGRGEVLGFIGPNGAGKSTTIRHLMGYLQQDAGRAEINGHDCWKEPVAAKARLGYLPGEIGFPQGISARTFLRMQGELRGHPDPTRRYELVERLRLRLNTPIGKMSKGMKQKLAIIATFMTDPEVVILDEPASGLDPLMQDELIALLVEAKRAGTTILLSSHIFEEVEAVADRISIIRDGRIVSHQTMDSVRAALRTTLRVTFTEDVAASSFPGFAVEQAGPRALVFRPRGDTGEIVTSLARHPVADVETERQSFRDYFREAYRGEAA
ncbi:ABC transporter ATP-binding protein [Streptomyces sp. AA0539]|uniref:ABC transporter ATP-binding protein n=1 Tax=Streptomyces sp. AA0539 TaxID=1210045 RepID=UPI0002EF01BF|nr:ABC transporter ATP-binding protein [Streptomyces sp. AA0539]